jgi:hypothetical protein
LGFLILQWELAQGHELTATTSIPDKRILDMNGLARPQTFGKPETEIKASLRAKFQPLRDELASRPKPIPEPKHSREDLRSDFRRRVDMARAGIEGVMKTDRRAIPANRSPALQRVEDHQHVAFSRVFTARRLNSQRKAQGLDPIDIHDLEADAFFAGRRMCEARGIERACDRLSVPPCVREECMDEVWIDEVSGWEFFDLDPCS